MTHDIEQTANDDDGNLPYIDSRGVEMPHMSFVDAVRHMLEMAESNGIDGIDIAFGEDLAEQAAQENRARETVAQVLSDPAFQASMNEMEPSYEARDWPLEATASGPESDPTVFADALRICLSSAEASMPAAENVRGIDEAEKFDENRQALDVVGDLLGMHQASLESYLVSRPAL